MNIVEIVAIHYDGEGPATVAVEGYPDQAIKMAREMMGAIFSARGAWHLTKIECASPAVRGKRLDSEWLVYVEADLKEGSQSDVEANPRP